MCGRFTVQVASAGVAAAFGVAETVRGSGPSFNVAPGQVVPVVVEIAGVRKLDAFHWGLVPSWAKDLSIGNRLINARAETLAEIPSFKRAFAARRCLILADGFYEWRTEGKGKRPYHITLERGGVFAFAGIWERWRPPGSEEDYLSCAIVTVEANPFMAALHHRMPVVLLPEAYGPWLDEGNRDAAPLQNLLVPYRGEMRAVLVSTLVNSPRNNRPECVLPLGDEPATEPRNQ
jgi:putative SOS response-associated peptidase YedK